MMPSNTLKSMVLKLKLNIHTLDKMVLVNTKPMKKNSKILDTKMLQQTVQLN
jgi:hypothetical protein